MICLFLVLPQSTHPPLSPVTCQITFFRLSYLLLSFFFRGEVYCIADVYVRPIFAARIERKTCVIIHASCILADQPGGISESEHDFTGAYRALPKEFYASLITHTPFGAYHLDRTLKCPRSGMVVDTIWWVLYGCKQAAPSVPSGYTDQWRDMFSICYSRFVLQRTLVLYIRILIHPSPGT